MESPAALSVASQFSLIIEGLLVAIAAHLEALLLTPAYRVLLMMNPRTRRELESLCRGLRREAALMRLQFAAIATPLLPPKPRDDAVGAVANDTTTTSSVTQPSGHGQRRRTTRSARRQGRETISAVKISFRAGRCTGVFTSISLHFVN